MRITHLGSIIVVQALFLQIVFAQQLFFQHYSVKDGLTASVFTSVEWSKAGLFVGTDQGVFVNKGDGSFNKIGRLPMAESYITRIGKLEGNRIWFSNTNGKLFYLINDAIQESIIPYQLKRKLSNTLIDQAQTSGKWIYISGVISGGLYVSDGNSFQLLNDSTHKARFMCMELGNNTLISGMHEGRENNDELLVKFKNGKNLIITLSEEEYHSKSIAERISKSRYIFSRGREVIVFNQGGVIERKFCHANIENILEDDEGKIWIGFAEGGLYCYPSGELSSNNFSRYLSRNTVYDMAADEKGDLWFATSEGLFSLPKLEEAAYVPPVFSERASKPSIKEQELFIDTTLAEVNEALSPFVSVEQEWPRTVFSAVRINNKDTILKDLYQLPADQNFLEIEFAGLIGNRPEAVQFKYRMNGLDTAWFYTTGNKVNYQALTPGTYTFYVHAQSKQGNWSEYPANLTFILSPPFWQTNTFFILLGIGLIVLIFIIVVLVEQLKRRSRMREEEFKKRVLQSELQALRAQMNPHFTFNTLSSIQNYISKNDADNASKYLSKFAKLMRTIMENAKQTDVSLEDELNALALYLELESLRLREKFEYKIDVDKEIDQQYARIPSMLIQPYVENAIWHGITNKVGKGKLVVEIKQDGNFLKCIVEDDGIGRKAAMKISARKRMHISQGMSITGERLELMNSLNKSSLSVEIIDKMNGNQVPCGTRVEIFIPLKDD